MAKASVAKRTAGQDVVAASIAQAREMDEELYMSVFRDRSDTDLATSLADYAASGETNMRCASFAVVRDPSEGETLVVAPNGLIFGPNAAASFDEFRKGLSKVLSTMGCEPLGVVVPGKGKRLNIIKNGDDADSDEGKLYGLREEPTISFCCLGRFFETRKNPTSGMLSQTGIKVILGGTILDFSPDETRKLTDVQRKKLSAQRKGNLRERATKAGIKVPESGFVLISSTGSKVRWHRSGSFLIRHKNATILLGVDEEVYFGCELRGKPNTLKEAYDDLIPEVAKGLHCERQGEWFAIPLSENEIPKLADALATVADGDSVALPVESDDSARHHVSGNEVWIMSSGLVAKDSTVCHSEDEHAELSLSGWYRFERNTAKRSFSEQGVD